MLYLYIIIFVYFTEKICLDFIQPLEFLPQLTYIGFIPIVDKKLLIKFERITQQIILQEDKYMQKLKTYTICSVSFGTSRKKILNVIHKVYSQSNFLHTFLFLPHTRRNDHTIIECLEGLWKFIC